MKVRVALPPRDSLSAMTATSVAKPPINMTLIITTRTLRERILPGPEKPMMLCYRKSPVMMAEPGALGSASTTVLADAGVAGRRLDRTLALHLPALSRTRLKQLIESGHVTCDGTAVRDPAQGSAPDRISS